MEKILESTNSDGLGETAWNEWGGVSSDFRLSAAHCWVLIAHGSKNEKNANLNTISIALGCSKMFKLENQCWPQVFLVKNTHRMWENINYLKIFDIFNRLKPFKVLIHLNIYYIDLGHPNLHLRDWNSSFLNRTMFDLRKFYEGAELKNVICRWI